MYKEYKNSYTFTVTNNTEETIDTLYNSYNTTKK